MSCCDCLCNECANSSELSTHYLTPGEGTRFCYTCDECRYYDGDRNKQSQKRTRCDAFKYPEKKAAMLRKSMRLVKGFPIKRKWWRIWKEEL